MRFIKILLIAMLVWAPVMATSVAQAGEGRTVDALRAEVRERLLQSVNARLQALAAAGAPLGVDVERIDMTPLLPPEKVAKAFHFYRAGEFAKAEAVAPPGR